MDYEKLFLEYLQHHPAAHWSALAKHFGVTEYRANRVLHEMEVKRLVYVSERRVVNGAQVIFWSVGDEEPAPFAIGELREKILGTLITHGALGYREVAKIIEWAEPSVRAACYRLVDQGFADIESRYDRTDSDTAHTYVATEKALAYMLKVKNRISVIPDIEGVLERERERKAPKPKAKKPTSLTLAGLLGI